MNNHLIVVGVDGSEGGRRALRWAVAEAARRGGSVQAITAWRWDGPGDAGPDGADAPAGRDQAADLLASEIAQLPAVHRTGVPIAGEVVEGRPAEVLTRASRVASLLVLGSHGHSRVWHTVLGSVSEECISNATCPVVVVPPFRTAPAVVGEPALRA